MEIAEIRKKAYQIRLDAVNMIYNGKTGHTGGSLSEADIMAVLFYGVMRLDAKNPGWKDRDRFLLSKGHSVECYYAMLADLGYFPRKDLASFSRFGTKLLGHPNNKVNGIEVNTGALGHGLSLGVGMALAARMDKAPYRVFVLMGDGEQAEGSVWEAAMSASHYKLNNLTAVIDRNGLQISGKTESVMSLEPLKRKWEAFGFETVEVDGHDHAALYRELSVPGAHGPKLVIADTIKGKGVSFMENQAKWHHGVPSAEQMEQAAAELREAMSK